MVFIRTFPRTLASTPGIVFQSASWAALLMFAGCGGQGVTGRDDSAAEVSTDRADESPESDSEEFERAIQDATLTNRALDHAIAMERDIVVVANSLQAHWEEVDNVNDEAGDAIGMIMDREIEGRYAGSVRQRYYELERRYNALLDLIDEDAARLKDLLERARRLQEQHVDLADAFEFRELSRTMDNCEEHSRYSSDLAPGHPQPFIDPVPQFARDFGRDGISADGSYWQEVWIQNNDVAQYYRATLTAPGSAVDFDGSSARVVWIETGEKETIRWRYFASGGYQFELNVTALGNNRD